MAVVALRAVHAVVCIVVTVTRDALRGSLSRELVALVARLAYQACVTAGEREAGP